MSFCERYPHKCKTQDVPTGYPLISNGGRNYAINRSAGNNAILPKNEMPAKFYPSDGGSTFSRGRQVYIQNAGYDYHRRNHKLVPQRKVGAVAGATEGANRQSSSSYIETKRNVAIGKSSKHTPGPYISFSGANRNDSNRARRRARSSGAVAPPKKGAIHYRVAC
jgi:hypothetical protein